MTIFLVVASIGCGKNPDFMACFWGKWWKHMKTPELCFWKTVIYDDLGILDDCSHVLFFENPCKIWHDLRLLHLFSDCRHKFRHLQHVIRSLLYGERKTIWYAWYVLVCPDDDYDPHDDLILMIFDAEGEEHECNISRYQTQHQFS